jgi:hypothetical protein
VGALGLVWFTWLFQLGRWVSLRQLRGKTQPRTRSKVETAVVRKGRTKNLFKSQRVLMLWTGLPPQSYYLTLSFYWLFTHYTLTDPWWQLLPLMALLVSFYPLVLLDRYPNGDEESGPRTDTVIPPSQILKNCLITPSSVNSPKTTDPLFSIQLISSRHPTAPHSRAKICVRFRRKYDIQYDATVSSKQKIGWMTFAKTPFPKLSLSKAVFPSKTINRPVAPYLPV